MGNRVLFFDFDYSGHHSEYIKHLMDYLASNERFERCIFVINPDFPMKFPLLLQKAEDIERIKVVLMTRKEFHLGKKGGGINRSLFAYWILKKYAKKFDVNRVILLHFNVFQLSLGLFRPSYEIEGILFLQFYHLNKRTLKEKLKYYRKYWITWFFLQNHQVKKVFILNDLKAVKYLNDNFKTTVFQMLPDPVKLLSPHPTFSLRAEYRINTERIIYLHFGSLYKGKGTLNILDSFDYLDDETLSKIAVFLVGKASDSMDSLIKSKILLIKQEKNNVCLIYRNEFIPDSLMKSFFDQSDFVLIPYKNIETSSGVFGHAMASGKPVIGPKQGLLGELIEENQWGISLETVSPESIARGIKNSINFSVNEYLKKEYLDSHSPRQFAQNLLD